MTDVLHNFEKAYALTRRNMENSGSMARLPDVRVAAYINRCTPGVLDVGDLMEADRTEFFQMAYYGLLGKLPDAAVLRRWQDRTDLSEWAYRRAVLDCLLDNPEVAARDGVVRGNIYSDADMTQARPHRSLKQRVLAAGYRVSRRLPLSIKAPLKRLVMKILMKS